MNKKILTISFCFVVLCVLVTFLSMSSEEVNTSGAVMSEIHVNSAVSKSHKYPLECFLNIKREKNQIYAELTFTNFSSETIKIEKRLLLKNEELDAASFFLVKHGSIKVPYKGRLIKRAPPKEKDYYQISPRSSVCSTILLNNFFDFSRGEVYTISYTFDYFDFSKTNYSTISSNIVEFKM